MFEDSFLEMEYEDRFEMDDLEMFNQNEASDYSHEYDDFDDWDAQFEDDADYGDAAWDDVDH